MSSPVIVLNFKTYSESVGKKAVEIARICEKVSEQGVDIVVAPQIPDLYRVAESVSIPVFAQHVDGVGAGSFTGHITAESLKENGVTGTLINHSERRLRLADIEAAIHMAKKANLTAILCTNNIPTTVAGAALQPDFVAVEPPELIGSGIPVSKADPQVVSGSVEAVSRIAPNVRVLCGAGISSGEDLRAAIELGSEGVLLASGIIKAADPEAALYDLIGKS
ncbi:triose-phosphate isomerase [Methanosarcinales archaeon ex4484_138]|nr:MAG: triose-phosphate isomerase [Methanosarcinales archaeon ex4484_138]RLG26777.1 MAG: triose-phosphate isomerase [Methanosarcinales archaeon]RLG28067.1 MAG: triose-phosphate isomerase [Methanosarcinales archaeon]HHI30693.1 triose-phosphate isomerase [Candidatus Methanoperedenaceae archaeon]